jgi:hypothetical protein
MIGTCLDSVFNQSAPLDEVMDHATLGEVSSAASQAAAKVDRAVLIRLSLRLNPVKLCLPSTFVV